MIQGRFPQFKFNEVVGHLRYIHDSSSNCNFKLKTQSEQSHLKKTTTLRMYVYGDLVGMDKPKALSAGTDQTVMHSIASE